MEPGGFACAVPNKYVEYVEPSCTASFDFLTYYDILAREMVFQEMKFSLCAVFSSIDISLLARFFRSSAVTDSLAEGIPVQVVKVATLEIERSWQN